MALIKVNPAYTSLIGRLKYANQFTTPHQAAAMVIARRGVGFSDNKLPRFPLCIVSGEWHCFSAPEDTLKMNFAGYLKLARRKYDAWFKEMLQEVKERAKRKAQPRISTN